MEDRNRFEKVYSQGALNTMEIWIDKETGVNYGLTPLLDRDGKPVVSPLLNKKPK